jgi:hypothetical protein
MNLSINIQTCRCLRDASRESITREFGEVSCETRMLSRMQKNAYKSVALFVPEKRLVKTFSHLRRLEEATPLTALRASG